MMKLIFNLFLLSVLSFSAIASGNQKPEVKPAKKGTATTTVTNIKVVKKVVPINVAKSSVKWTGRKVTGQHTGHVKVKKGQLEFMGQDLVGGSFVIDMTSITCTDLKDKDYNKKLVGHLKSDDFFSVEKHKEAKLKIKSVMMGKGGHYDVNGDLTIKGITKPIMFMVNLIPKGKNITAKTQIKFNRVHYNIKYNSGSFFKGLGDKMIYDDVVVDVKLTGIL